MDISKTIQPKSDQLNADDLIAGPITITITAVKVNPTATQQPVAINYDGDNGKPYKPSLGMRRVMVQLWGADESKYVGRKLQLYRDDTVKYAGANVGGIRISGMSDIPGEKPVLVTEKRGARKSITIKPITKPTLTPGTDLWQKVAAKKPTREQVLAHYEISDEHLKQLIQ